MCYCEPNMKESTNNAMFSHVSGDNSWKLMPLKDCLAMVERGQARECFDCDYGDGLRSFHCTAPCSQCDINEGPKRAPTRIND